LLEKMTVETVEMSYEDAIQPPSPPAEETSDDESGVDDAQSSDPDNENTASKEWVNGWLSSANLIAGAYQLGLIGVGPERLG